MGKTDDKAKLLAEWFYQQRIPLMFFDQVVAKAKAILEEYSREDPEVSEKKRQRRQTKKI